MSAPPRARSSLGIAPVPSLALAPAAALTLALVLLAAPARAATETLAVSEDTWIDGTGSSTPQGSNTILGICPRQEYWIYLKFDLSTLTGPPIDAEIRMTRTQGDRPEEISVYLITDDSWDEATLTGMNRPAPTNPDPADALGVGEEIVPYDRWTSMALTDVIAQEYAGDGVLSVMLREDPVQMFDVRHYDSREAAVGDDAKPQLVVTTGSTAVDDPGGFASWGSVKAGYR
jgi:hypothetical protein